MLRILTIFIFSIVISGCGHHRYFKGFEDIPANSGSVYVIRPSSFVNLGAALEIKVGSNNLGYLQNGHFLNTLIEPGKYKVTAYATGSFGKQREIEITVYPNERIYLEAGFGLEGYFGIKQIDSEVALSELNEFTDN
tara:strand:- start:571 stop:981 length:411 start_codon:yes stop_codon:yes gene_type:complete